MGRKIEFVEVGEVFGRLTVVALAGQNDKGLSMAHLRCECGSVLFRPCAQLRRGGVRSCGCLSAELCQKLGFIMQRRRKKEVEDGDE